MTAHANETNLEVHSPRSGLRFFAFFLLFFASLLFFTLMKMPQARVQAWLLGTANQALAPAGFHISAEEGQFVFGLGLKYEMKGLKVTNLQNDRAIQFSRLEISPDLLGPLLQGKIGADLTLEQGSGTVQAATLVSLDQQNFDFVAEIDNLHLGKLGVLPFLAGIQGGAELKGKVDLSGPVENPSQWNGELLLKLNRIQLEDFSIGGLIQIPKLQISDAEFNLPINQGKLVFKNARLGKSGGTDDLHGAATGDLRLGSSSNAMVANIRAQFQFSDKYLAQKSTSFIAATLQMFKRPDGMCGIRVSGPLYPMPEVVPDL